MIGDISSAFGGAINTDGFWILVAAVFVAGLVRGFSGFGTSMIYMPFAGTVLPPVWALITVLVFDAFGPLPNVPRALRDGAPRDVMRLVLGAFLGVPLGLFLLYRIDPEVFRWLVSAVSLVLLVLLISGWRYKGEISRVLTLAIGSLGGVLGGISGLAGPPVIMFYMSSMRAVKVVRANILLYLLMFDFFSLAMMAISGLLEVQPVVIGILLTLPYLIANIIGAALFRPEFEKIYRRLAYTLIAGAALSNLPLFG